VESSQALRQVQHNKLAPIAERNGWELAWHDTIEDIPKTPDLYTMLVAHEFFDALPIHVFEVCTHLHTSLHLYYFLTGLAENGRRVERSTHFSQGRTLT
jgi:SAM-dependent MidA family methyltransferase